MWMGRVDSDEVYKKSRSQIVQKKKNVNITVYFKKEIYKKKGGKKKEDTLY